MAVGLDEGGIGSCGTPRALGPAEGGARVPAEDEASVIEPKHIEAMDLHSVHGFNEFNCMAHNIEHICLIRDASKQHLQIINA